MIVLGLDPANLTGWAIVRDGKPVECGVWQLTLAADSDANARLIRLQARLTAVLGGAPIDIVAFEEASFGSHNPRVQAGHNELAGIIKLVCAEKGVRYAAYNPGTIKLFATSSGRAKKPQMIAAAKRILGLDGLTADEADAVWVAMLAHHEATNPAALRPVAKGRRRPKRPKEKRLFR